MDPALLALAGRILVGVIFVVVGVRLLMARSAVASLLATKKVPQPAFVALAGGSIEIVLGAQPQIVVVEAGVGQPVAERELHLQFTGVIPAVTDEDAFVVARPTVGRRRRVCGGVQQCLNLIDLREERVEERDVPVRADRQMQVGEIGGRGAAGGDDDHLHARPRGLGGGGACGAFARARAR